MIIQLISNLQYLTLKFITGEHHWRSSSGAPAHISWNTTIVSGAKTTEKHKSSTKKNAEMFIFTIFVKLYFLLI